MDSRAQGVLEGFRRFAEIGFACQRAADELLRLGARGGGALGGKAAQLEALKAGYAALHGGLSRGDSEEALGVGRAALNRHAAAEVRNALPRLAAAEQHPAGVPHHGEVRPEPRALAYEERAARRAESRGDALPLPQLGVRRDEPTAAARRPAEAGRDRRAGFPAQAGGEGSTDREARLPLRGEEGAHLQVVQAVGRQAARSV